MHFHTSPIKGLGDSAKNKSPRRDCYENVCITPIQILDQKVYVSGSSRLNGSMTRAIIATMILIVIIVMQR